MMSEKWNTCVVQGGGVRDGDSHRHPNRSICHTCLPPPSSPPPPTASWDMHTGSVGPTRMAGQGQGGVTSRVSRSFTAGRVRQAAATATATSSMRDCRQHRSQSTCRAADRAATGRPTCTTGAEPNREPVDVVWLTHSRALATNASTWARGRRSQGARVGVRAGVAGVPGAQPRRRAT